MANQNFPSQEVESEENRSYHAPILMLVNSKAITPSELVTEAIDGTGPAQAAVEEIAQQENREYHQNILPLTFGFAILTSNMPVVQANASRSIAKSIAIMPGLEQSHIAPAFYQGVSRVGNSVRLLNEYVATRTGQGTITASHNAESPTFGGVSPEIFAQNSAISLPEANYPKNVTASKEVTGETFQETKSPTPVPRKPLVKIQGIYDSNISREESEESELVELRRKISRILAEEFRRFYGTK
jgi:hypothetical protein